MPVLRPPRAAGAVLAVAAAFAVATVAWTWPLVIKLRSGILFPVPDVPELVRSDAWLTTWVLAWGSHALRTAPLRLFDANTMYPLTGTLAFSEHLLAGVLLLLPVDLLLGADPVRNHNLLVLATFVAGGTGTALLLHELGTSWAAGLLAGALFVFSPFRHGTLYHVQVLSVQWMPWTLYFLHRLLARGRRGAGAAFAACFLLQLWSSVYWFYLFGLAVALLLALHAVWRCPAAPGARWKALGWACAAGLASLPVMWPYAWAREVYALGRDAGEAWFLSSKIVTYLGVLLDPRAWLANRYGDAPGGAGLFGPGTLLLVVLGCVRGAAPGAGGRRVAGCYLTLAAAMALVSFGPSIQRATLLDPPYPGVHDWIARVVPGWSALRALGRTAIVVVLPVVVVAGLGADALLSRARRRLPRAAVLTVLAAVTLSETWRPGLFVQRLPWGRTPPAAYAWLDGQPGPGAVVELPAGTLQSEVRAMLLSTTHWRPLVNGYSGFTPLSLWQRLALNAFPDPEVLRTLHGLGVRWVVVRGRELLRDPTPCALTEAELGPFLAHRYGDAGLCVLELLGAPSPTVVPERRVPSDGVVLRASGGSDVAAALDDDRETHWVVDVAPNTSQWLDITLPEARPLSRVVLRLGGHWGEYLRQCRVEVSDGDEQWRTLVVHDALVPPLAELRTHPGDLSVVVPLPPGTVTRRLRLVAPVDPSRVPIDLYVNWTRWGVHEVELWEPAPG